MNTYFRNAGGDTDASQIAAREESTVPNPGHAAGKIDTGQTAAIEEGIMINSGHLAGENNVTLFADGTANQKGPIFVV